MLKKTINFVNHFGEPKQVDCYFHLSRTELTKLQLSQKGGLVNKMLGLTGLNSENVKDKDVKPDVDVEHTKEIIDIFETIILTAYGKRCETGDGFQKNEAIKEEFKNSIMYDVLFQELLSNPDEAASFFKGIMPKDLDVKSLAAKQ